MAWRSLSPDARCLTLTNCLPSPVNGSIPLSVLGGNVHLPSLVKALIPDLTIADWDDGWAYRAWSEGGAKQQGERFVRCLEWLVVSDARSARRLLEIAPAVLTPGDAIGVAGVLAAASDADGQSLLRQAAQKFLLSAPQPSGSSGATFTRSQAAAFSRISAMARAHFDQASMTGPITPRFFPLVVGPTGVGKSNLLRRIADAHQARYIRTSLGEWIVLGARHASPTIPGILSALMAGPVVLLIDELDKVSVDGTGWTRSVLAEVFSLLDRNIPQEALASMNDGPRSSEDIESLVRKRLFIAGAGTWQHAWSGNSTVGFGAQVDARSRVVSQLESEKIVPVELLRRFTSPTILLEYPQADETQELYDRLGLTALAKLAGVTLDPAAHDWTRGGMRSVESLAGDLILRIQSPFQSKEVCHAES